MIADDSCERINLSTMTPQFRNNRKSLEIKRITHRLSLLKKLLKKHKDETSLDKTRLRKMSEQAREF